MSFFPRIFACASVLLAAALFAARARATPFDPRGEDWEGLSELVRIAQAELEPQRVVTTSTLDLGTLQRSDALLIVHPEHPLDAEELAAFMHAGGRVILLDDFGAGDSLLAHFGIKRVPMPQHPAEMLRNNPAFAIAEPASGHPAVRDVARVVTNHATGLEHPGLSPVLVVHAEEEPDVLLALAGAVGQGRLLVFGDASLPINSMLRYPGNLSLTRELVRYSMEEDAWGKRTGKLYILTNAFETTGSFGIDSELGGVLGRARRAALDAVEGMRRGGMPAPVAFLGAVALGLGVIGWTVLRAGRTHRATQPRFARPIAGVAQGGVAGHAATLGAPGTSRLLAVLEVKSAIEEELATRLGFDKAPPHDILIARVRAAGLMGDDAANALAGLLETLSRLEVSFAGRRRLALARMRDAEVLAVAARAREVLAAAAEAPRVRVVQRLQ
jgi:hypothetical protein